MNYLIQKVLAKEGGANPPGLEITPPGGIPPDLSALLVNITAFLLKIVAPLAGLMILWGAFQILTAGGNPGKLEAGKKTIIYAAVGLVLIILSYGITGVIKDVLTQK